MSKRKVRAANIRAALIRISKGLRASPVNRDKDRRAKQTTLLPAVEFVDAAGDAMKGPRINPATASHQCRRAMELLREHDELSEIITDLDEMIEDWKGDEP